MLLSPFADQIIEPKRKHHMMKFQTSTSSNASFVDGNGFAGRRPGMSRNAAGGFSYKVSDWDQLDRFLILGTTEGTYYIDKNAVVELNVDALNRCLDSDAERVVQRVLEITRDNRAMSKDPALFVLALAASRKQSRAVTPRDGRPVFTIEDRLRRRFGRWKRSRRLLGPSRI